MSGQNGPRDDGEKLAELPRYGGGRLVLSLETYEGHPYISLRALDPQKGNRHLTIKAKELPAVIAALEQARERIGGGQ